MTASDELFQLIKSLDKNEKRYFKMFSELQSGSKNYVTLFDAIDKQQNYDEEKLKQVLSKELFIKRLAIEKVHLYKHILKALDIYDLSDEKSKFRTQFRHVHILIKKGFSDQAEKILFKLKKETIEQEDFLFLVEVLRTELTLKRTRGFADTKVVDIESTQSEIINALIKEKNIEEYSTVKKKLFIIQHTSGFSRHLNLDKDFDDIMQDPILSDEKHALSVKALYHYYQCHEDYFTAKMNFEKALLYNHNTIVLLEKTNFRIKALRSGYISVVHNHILYLTYLKRFSEIPPFLEKLRSIPELFQELSENRKNRIYYQADYLEIALYTYSFNFDKAVTQISLTETQLKKRAQHLNKTDEMALGILCAYTYFLAGNYKACKRSLHSITQENIGVRMDVLCLAKIMNLIVYFEQNDTESLEYAIKSTYRFLSNTNSIYGFETVLLNFLKKKLFKVKTNEELKTNFKELLKELKHLFKDPYEATVLQYLDYISWLESKIEKRPFAEVVREKTVNNRQTDKKQ